MTNLYLNLTYMSGYLQGVLERGVHCQYHFLWKEWYRHNSTEKKSRAPKIQSLIATTTKAIPSSAHTTPNPGDSWDDCWSVDEGSAAVRVEAGDMNAGCCAGIKQIHRKVREGRKDNVVSASRSLRTLRCLI
jgi:hypothetical protein